MDNEKLVELVTAAVMRRLEAGALAEKEPSNIPCKKALAIFTGGTIGLEESLRELKKIQDLQVEVSVVLSAAAEKIIGIDRIKEHLGSRITFVTTESPYPGTLLREADFILVPVLTQNTAAKLAYTLADTLASTVIMQGLMLGKPVLAAMNAADPQDSWRVQKNMGKSSPALSESLRQNLKKIEGYGIQLMHVDQLAMGSQKIMERLAKKTSESQQSQSQVAGGGKKIILDAAAIEVAASNGLTRIAIPKNAIVTPLARDLARDHGIEILQELG